MSFSLHRLLIGLTFSRWVTGWRIGPWDSVWVWFSPLMDACLLSVCGVHCTSTMSPVNMMLLKMMAVSRFMCLWWDWCLCLRWHCQLCCLHNVVELDSRAHVALIVGTYLFILGMLLLKLHNLSLYSCVQFYNWRVDPLEAATFSPSPHVGFLYFVCLCLAAETDRPLGTNKVQSWRLKSSTRQHVFLNLNPLYLKLIVFLTTQL